MTDADLVRAALRAAGLTQTALGRVFGHRDGRTVRSWLSGSRNVCTTNRRLLAVIAKHPEVATWLTPTEDET